MKDLRAHSLAHIHLIECLLLLGIVKIAPLQTLCTPFTFLTHWANSAGKIFLLMFLLSGIG
jgi:hypothetical protein